jgi:hypothetical protein
MPNMYKILTHACCLRRMRESLLCKHREYSCSNGICLRKRSCTPTWSQFWSSENNLLDSTWRIMSGDRTQMFDDADANILYWTWFSIGSIHFIRRSVSQQHQPKFFFFRKQWKTFLIKYIYNCSFSTHVQGRKLIVSSWRKIEKYFAKQWQEMHASFNYSSLLRP